MFKGARVRLTIIYCAVFFAIFWSLSLGIYFWMENSFGEGYISEVETRETEHDSEAAFSDNSAHIVTIAGDVALNQLGETLIILNGCLLLIVPPLAWLLTVRTLKPIEDTYEKQKRFVSDASHELRTPLTIVQGELEIALKKDRSKPEYRQAMESAQAEVGRLHELVEDLLIEAKTTDASSAQLADDVDLVDLLTETIERLSAKAEAKQVKIGFIPPPEAATVRGSATLLDRLFSNIIDNAIRMTKPGSGVQVSVQPSRETISTSISDAGPGMTAEAISHVFDRFYQADSSRTHEGFGLGLPIAKTIAEQHGGTIVLSSEIGQGTTVSVTLRRSFSPLSHIRQVH